jgi:hypothetical protein
MMPVHDPHHRKQQIQPATRLLVKTGLNHQKGLGKAVSELASTRRNNHLSINLSITKPRQ